MSVWTPDDLAFLRKNWGGALSAAQIGALLDKTRNAIIGKAHRLNLPTVTRRGPAAWKPISERAKPRKRVYGPRPVVVRAAPVRVEPLPPAPEPGSLNLLLTDLEAGQCHWPVNDGGPYLFCGAAQHERSAYCRHHHDRSRNAVTATPRPLAWLRMGRAA